VRENDERFLGKALKMPIFLRKWLKWLIKLYKA
jgi:hypothetical protein